MQDVLDGGTVLKEGMGESLQGLRSVKPTLVRVCGRGSGVGEGAEKEANCGKTRGIKRKKQERGGGGGEGEHRGNRQKKNYS